MQPDHGNGLQQGRKEAGLVGVKKMLKLSHSWTIGRKVEGRRRKKKRAQQEQRKARSGVQKGAKSQG